MSQEAISLTKKDFESDQEVRWCPGCGDYAILNAVQKTIPTLGIPKENFVFVSGIGCSSRFPYYMNAFGFHTIHGRAPAVATGIKIANPELSVWVITGDGDSLSIGGNHFMHTLRRNVDLNILLFNNKIYGLTKGQYSPTSEQGKKTKSTPYGSLDYPANASALALASGATFFARSFDVGAAHLQEMVAQAANHKGVSLIEIYQNCNIFNDGAYEPIIAKQVRSEQILDLKVGTPMLFGENLSKGIILEQGRPKVAVLGENGITEKDILIHDPKNTVQAYMLTQMDYPHFPVPMGVFQKIEKPSFDQMVHEQNKMVVEKKGVGSLEKLIQGPDSWLVK